MVTIPPFGTVSVNGSTGISGHCMQVQVLAEPAQGPKLPASVVLTTTYGELHPGSSQVPICLRNLSAHPIVVPTKVIVGKVTLANQVLPVVLPMETPAESICNPQKEWILEELSLQGLEEGVEVEQEQARELLLKWEHPFAHSSLGKTSLIKHQTELMDQMPFKKCYWHIPPHMYDDVKAHLQEMLDIGAIQKSHSPWANVVVLVWKKDRSLRFFY